ncbi:MAG: hypothetical protein ABI790_14980 [Betaproteobacteria bacterium]
MNNKLPYVTVATFCEKVLNEEDGVLSAIRIFDTMKIQLTKDAAQLDAPQMANLLVVMKSGDFIGKGVVKIVGVSPDGKELKGVVTMPMTFEGGAHGNNLIVSMAIRTNKSGLYWYETYFNDKFLTRTPLSVYVTEKPTEKPQPTKSLPKKSKAK